MYTEIRLSPFRYMQGHLTRWYQIQHRNERLSTVPICFKTSKMRLSNISTKNLLNKLYFWYDLTSISKKRYNGKTKHGVVRHIFPCTIYIVSIIVYLKPEIRKPRSSLNEISRMNTWKHVHGRCDVLFIWQAPYPPSNPSIRQITLASGYPNPSLQIVPYWPL